MKNRPDIETDSEIVSEACAWVAQIESGAMSASDMAALREWMERSPVHAREIRSVAALSGRLSVLTELAPALEASAGVHSKLRKQPQRRFVTPAVAVIMLVITAGALLTLLHTPAAIDAPTIYQTAIGEYETIVLDDGTSVSLNTDSQIEVAFSESERRVRMINGEALFEVAPNPTWPFVVYSDTAVAEAVGTSFVLRLRDAITELAVVEGAVAFSSLTVMDASADRTPNAAVPAEPERLLQDIERVVVTAGQTLTSGDIPKLVAEQGAPDLSILSDREIQRRLSWTEGFLEFSQTPLETVVAELTRHNDVTIEIADPSLKSLKFGGIFRTGDVDELLDALSGLGVAVEQQDDKTYRLLSASENE